MSQTIEFALARLFKTWHIDNVPVWDHVSNVVVNSGKGKIDADGIERLAEKTMQSEGLLILRLPESLRKQDEDFFVRVAVAVGLDDIADLDKLLALARDGYRDDLSVEDVAERYKEVHRTKR